MSSARGGRKSASTRKQRTPPSPATDTKRKKKDDVSVLEFELGRMTNDSPLWTTCPFPPTPPLPSRLVQINPVFPSPLPRGFFATLFSPHPPHEPELELELELALRNSLNDTHHVPMPAMPAMPSTPKPKRPEDQPLPYDKQTPCPICLTYRPTHIAIPCGHSLGCDWCANELLERQVKGECLHCRKKIESIQRIWI